MARSSSSSSESALPSLMEKMEKAGCPRPVVGLVVPAGYSFNLDGSIMYMTFATVFIAQSYGIDMSMADQIKMMLILLITSKSDLVIPGPPLRGILSPAATSIT